MPDLGKSLDECAAASPHYERNHRALLPATLVAIAFADQCMMSKEE